VQGVVIYNNLICLFECLFVFYLFIYLFVYVKPLHPSLLHSYNTSNVAPPALAVWEKISFIVLGQKTGFYIHLYSPMNGRENAMQYTKRSNNINYA